MRKKTVMWVFVGWFVVGFASLLSPSDNPENELDVVSAKTTIVEVSDEVCVALPGATVKVAAPDNKQNIVELHLDKEHKKSAMLQYLQEKSASPELMELIPMLVELCYIYDIDPFRPMSIIIHETEFGKSRAFYENKNVAGINWTNAQKKKIGIKSNVYNLAVEKTRGASVTNLVLLLSMYKNFKTPLVTLSQIQTKYAPSDDARNGLSGMDNSTWAKNTIAHYYNIESIYLDLKRED